ncbi:serine/threonine-protein kinase [Bythopirellula polymerisocia]|uniref:Serine/threonine-protein kinase StkP n=1 Tax=Bythopirellula polymerisocia TaxID=2528003 RepID=A0A5C6CQR9_9BACT|nr:serine/threonine-protein kinase [Bythopirellula polymerisocia]TWU27263.1 Serine/threonine-protein kinase StkP [Bythopirellula polymerisocia]
MRAERSILERAGLASGLLTEEQIDRAWQVLVESLPAENQGLDEISDEQLSAQMIALGYLNRWQAEQLRLGRTKFTLGAYRILDAVGHGGMGWVFKCEHVLLGRIEAIKVLPKNLTNPTSIASFLQEIRAQAQLTHPNLVHLTYADKEGDTYFLVTEYVPGTDLRKLVRNHGPLSMSEAAVIVSQAAEALAYAHRCGLVHRDVKPGNLLITPEGAIKLADLGLAAFHNAHQTPSGKKPRHIVGTADYVAPEIIVSPEKLQTVSDIYSLGCTLYYAVTGKVPFPGGDTADKLRRNLEETPLTPQKLNSNVSDEFARVITALMEKRPADRIATAEEVVVLLSPWVTGAETEARQHVGSMTKLSGTLDHQSNLADTLPVEYESSETQDVHEDTTDAGSLGGMTLPQIVATERSLLVRQQEEQAKQEEKVWPLEKIILATAAAAVFTAGAAIYLLFFGE